MISLCLIDLDLLWLWLWLWLLILILGAPLTTLAERRRGAEWWGKSPLVTLVLFSKVTRRKGETNISPHLNNGYVLRPKCPPTNPK
ncbi:hypothetical protein DYL59_14050 [Pseudomonas kairouanensis]|uniref:Uncharacterized protein n=1 Tax=Pseudomonas kairouanensis TaxID=2293832 RepID=A0A4Z0APM3_9PSED|nr:hypothetical protein DYL59_14050 [Pseudomonas kairouanensis]